jgi:hypothetical protein
MSIPNYSVTKNELAQITRQQEEAAKLPRVEQALKKELAALEADLAGLPASDSSSLVEPLALAVDRVQN